MGDKGELGVKNLKKIGDVTYEWPKTVWLDASFLYFFRQKKPFRPIHKYTYYITNLAVGIKKKMLALFLECIMKY